MWPLLRVLGIGPKTLVFIGLAIFLAFYYDTSPPSFSREVTSWMTKGKYMVYHGKKIFYREDKSKRSYGYGVLCLHGFPSSSYDWVKMWPGLLTRFGKVIAPDFLGFGFSDKPWKHPYNIIEQSDFMEALMEQLNVKKVHILAHDYGDSVAQELLARYNDRQIKNKTGLDILSVTLLNGGIFPETNHPRITQTILTIPFLNHILSRLANFYTFKRGFSEIFGPNTQPSETELHDFWTAIKVNDGNLAFPKILGFMEERKLRRERWCSALQDTKVSVLCIYGPSDPVNPPAFIDHFKKLVPNAAMHVLSEHIGHYPQWEAPQETMDAINKFISSIPPKEDYEDE